jgi:hypothetical protein
MSDPDPGTLVRRRANQRDIGLTTMIVGAIVLATSPWRIPLPLPVWLEIVLGILVLLVGAYNFVRSHRLPTQEVLVLIRLNGGLVTPALLVEKMGLEPDNAEQILRVMHLKGMLRAEAKAMNRGQNMVYYHMNEPNTPVHSG